MRLVLNYHRITQEPRADRFYTVPAEWLRAHLAAVESRGLPIVRLDALQEGQCALTFDDGTPDHARVVAPILAERGWPATFFVPTNRLDQPGGITSAELRALADAGHLIGCHSHDHLRLDRKSEGEIRTQLQTSLELLRGATGSTPKVLAPPGGFVNARVRRIAAELGLTTLRTMRWGLNEATPLDDLECLPLNRKITPARFARLLDGHGLGWLRLVYAGKELLKKALPQEAYYHLREWLARPSRTG
jgi:peptidoglycan/xylan/chitin deacetylase (PgdA/CDA1 family)